MSKRKRNKAVKEDSLPHIEDDFLSKKKASLTVYLSRTGRFMKANVGPLTFIVAVAALFLSYIALRHNDSNSGDQIIDSTQPILLPVPTTKQSLSIPKQQDVSVYLKNPSANLQLKNYGKGPATFLSVDRIGIIKNSSDKQTSLFTTHGEKQSLLDIPELSTKEIPLCMESEWPHDIYRRACLPEPHYVRAYDAQKHAFPLAIIPPRVFMVVVITYSNYNQSRAWSLSLVLRPYIDPTPRCRKKSDKKINPSHVAVNFLLLAELTQSVDVQEAEATTPQFDLQIAREAFTKTFPYISSFPKYSSVLSRSLVKGLFGGDTTGWHPVMGRGGISADRVYFTRCLTYKEYKKERVPRGEEQTSFPGNFRTG